MNIRKAILFTAIGASAALSSAASAQPDTPPAWSFGGRNSPWIEPSDVGFPRPSAEPSVSHKKHHVRENSQTREARY
jgi:hypothetical protein